MVYWAHSSICEFGSSPEFRVWFVFLCFRKSRSDILSWIWFCVCANCGIAFLLSVGMLNAIKLSEMVDRSICFRLCILSRFWCAVLFHRSD